MFANKEKGPAHILYNLRASDQIWILQKTDFLNCHSIDTVVASPPFVFGLYRRIIGSYSIVANGINAGITVTIKKSEMKNYLNASVSRL